MKRNKIPPNKSLMAMTIDFIDRTVPDRRRTVLEIEKTNIDVALAYKLTMEYTSEWFRIEDLEKTMLFLRRREDPMLTTEIAFFYKDYDYEEGVVGGVTEIAKLPIAFYFAATYEYYDMETLEIHIDELEHYPRIKLEYYLDCMAKYNEKLPDEVKLWLSLR